MHTDSHAHACRHHRNGTAAWRERRQPMLSNTSNINTLGNKSQSVSIFCRRVQSNQREREGERETYCTPLPSPGIMNWVKSRRCVQCNNSGCYWLTLACTHTHLHGTLIPTGTNRFIILTEQIIFYKMESSAISALVQARRVLFGAEYKCLYKCHPVPFVVHYLWPGLGSKVVHYVGNRDAT